ncbi:MAG: hypothetical protein QM706_10285 [Nitrospira sp.]
MRRHTFTAGLVGLMFAVGSLVLPPSPSALAEEFGGIEAGKWVVGFRVGFAPLTQQLSQDTASDQIGPLVNFQGLYSLNTWALSRNDARMGTPRSQRGGA